MRSAHYPNGFSLVELMVSLAIGLVVSVAIIQVMVSNRVTSDFNQRIAEVQESGRFILTRVKNELLETGLYDALYTPISPGVDIPSEEAFVRNHPIILANHLDADPTLTSSDGAGGTNDEIIISLQAETDCTGSSYGAAVGSEQHMINHYFVANNALKCTGYNGRVMRNVSAGTGSSGTVTLMDEVISFQVQYGISDVVGTISGNPVQYVTADQLLAAEAASQFVVAIRIGILLQSSDAVSNIADKDYTVLNVSGLSVESGHYGQVFSHTIALRNMKNFARSI